MTKHSLAQTDMKYHANLKFAWLWLLLMCWGPFCQAQTLHMAADNWAPMTGQGLQQEGFSVDLARQVFHELGYDLTLEFMPWDQIMKLRGSGDYQVIPAVWYTPQRSEHLHFSQAYDSSKLVFISRQSDSFQYAGPQSLKGKTLGFVKSYAYPEHILQAQGIKIVYASDAKEALQMLASGRLHLTLGDYMVMKFEATRHVHPAHKLFYDIQHPLADIPLHMAVSRRLSNHDELVEGINRVLKIFKEDGRYRQLKKKHGLD